MSSKYDSKSDEKYSDEKSEEKFSDDKCDFDDFNDEKLSEFPKVEITSVSVDPIRSEISDPFDLKIEFALDKDVVAAYWQIKFLVDSAEKRLIKILGETPVEDYPDGDSEMIFTADSVDISGIPPSTLANAGLLIACFIVDGEEVAAVNMVVNVRVERGKILREILNPLE